jgi:aryl-alcohol dehydrogenase-like predicted oxidoreductase
MTMRYRVLGGTGITVSVHCLGAMMFGKVGNPDHDDCVRIVHSALDQGVNFVDTADMYSAGESETIVGKALKDRRDDVVLATKVHFQMGDDRNHGGNSRRWIVREVEASLKRLRTDWIDLYQIHRPDYTTDIEETLSTLTDLVHQGKIRTFGCSTFPPEETVNAYHVAERRGLMRFRTEQPPYSLLSRGIEKNVLPICQRYDMGVLVWGPLASGFLSGRHRKGQPVEMTGRAGISPHRFDPELPSTVAKLDVVEKLVDVANDVGCTLPELAMAFAVTHPAVTSAIIGPRTMDQLDSILKSAELTLDDATLDRIDEIVPPGTTMYDAAPSSNPAALTKNSLRRPVDER